ncbi:hypothetical protein K1T71_011791 [Dendrolimus kikuchii]|uniref:Uncharacterized protein n=1 Tax=Dendrolimus kikuchii TaxID=765133 RepID=A0ACC1CM53_9NEOP|nr:hypothetical protein K1T71_011791 [Dendrolimus kikuchii]
MWFTDTVLLRDLLALWTNIRSTFANYLRKFNASLAKGDREEFKINWHLWNACKFLLKVNKKNIKSINLTENSINENEFEDLNHYDAHETDCIEETQSANNLTCNNMVQKLVIAFQNIQDGTNQNSKYSEVGRMVAKKLSEMNSYEAAITVNKITEILLLFEENTVVNPNDIKSEIK